MRSSKTDTWRVPNQLIPSHITGKAETLEVPKSGLINLGGYVPRNRPKIGLGPLNDVSQFIPGTSQQQVSLDHLDNVPSTKQHLRETQRESWNEFKSHPISTWLPIGGPWPYNIGDVREEGAPKNTDAKDKPWGGIIKRTIEIPKTWPTPPPEDPPPPSNSQIPQYAYWAYGLSLTTRRKKRLPPRPLFREKNSRKYGTYPRKTRARRPTRYSRHY